MSRPRLQAQRGACVMSRGVKGGRKGRASETTDRHRHRHRDGDGDGNSDRSTCDVEIQKKLIDRFGGHCRQRGSLSRIGKRMRMCLSEWVESRGGEGRVKLRVGADLFAVIIQ